MKRVLVFLSLVIIFNLYGQGGPGNQPPAQPQPETKDNKPAEKHGEMKDYFPLATYDARLKVQKVSFLRRHAGNGKGEVLDVQVELENRAQDPVEYAIYVLAINESDSIDEERRSLAPYPKWRAFDALKKDFRINFSNLSPSNIDIKDIWGEKVYNEKKAKIEEKVIKGEKARLGEPSLWEYILYLSKNPDKAKKFTLYGENGPPSEKVIDTNFKSGNLDDEQKLYTNSAVPKHSYTIYNARYQATVFSHHYNQFRPNYYTFNKVVVLIFDPSRKTNQLVHRSFYEISGLKITN